MRTEDIHWLAGLIEGEACFSPTQTPQGKVYPRLPLGMKDHDVLLRAARLLGKYPRQWENHKTKPFYMLQVSGRRAVEWMMTLYPLLGRRRQAQIFHVLAGWRASSS